MIRDFRFLFTLVFGGLLLLFPGPGVSAPGEIEIVTEFPGGNAKVTANKPGAVELEPDLRGDRPWFYWCFEAKVIQPGEVTFTFPEKVAGFAEGGVGHQGPAIGRKDESGKWTWTWQGRDAGGGRAFTHDFETAGEILRFAVSIPYLESDLEAFLERHRENSSLEVSTLAKSREGREVELLQVGRPGTDRRAMLVTGRHHAVETMASFVLEGFLDEALSGSDEAQAFRDRFVLYAVPFVDKDGVENGDQGKNRKPHDHNRDYTEAPIYPEVKAIMALGESKDVRYALDFHCPTLVMNDHQVMYFVGAKVHPPHNEANVREFAGRIRKGLPEGAPVGPLVWLRDENQPSPKSSRHFGFREGAVVSATLEIPFAPKDRLMEPEHCREYGRVMLRAWVRSEFQVED